MSEHRYGCTALSIDPTPSGPDGGDGGRGGESDGIDGVVVEIPVSALPALDAREANYDRLALPREAFSLPEAVRADAVFAYRTSEARRRDPDVDHPVLRTYVDCIMAGYLERFGEAGLEAWLATTDGWEAPLFDDREAPRYPRAVALPASLLARFDDRLAARRGTPETPPPSWAGAA